MIKWGALFGWGVVIYAVVFLMWSALVIHAYIAGPMPRIILVLTLAIVVSIAARSLRLKHWYDILPYSIAWALIAAAFDFTCAVPVSGFAIWTDWNIWVGYAMVVLIPLIIPQPKKHVVHHRPS